MMQIVEAPRHVLAEIDVEHLVQIHDGFAQVVGRGLEHADIHVLHEFGLFHLQQAEHSGHVRRVRTQIVRHDVGEVAQALVLLFFDIEKPADPFHGFH